MTITDEDCRHLSEHVYWIDPMHRNYKKDSYKEGRIKKIGTKEFKILRQKENSKIDGMQAMAVAPVINGNVVLSFIVLVYAGTNTADIKDISTDLITIGGFLDKTASSGFSIERSPQRLKGQANSALQFAKEVKTAFACSQITTTGHSLGEYLALMVAAENQWHNIGFNGPDPYELLTSKAKKWTKSHASWLKNYRHQGDLLGNLMGNKTGAEIKINLGKDLFPFQEDYHSLASWNFDAKGKLVIPKKDFNQKARVKQEIYRLNEDFDVKWRDCQEIKRTLKKQTKGELSKNVRLYLDSKQAYLVVTSIQAKYHLAITDILNIYQKAIQETNTAWQETLKLARNQTTLLSNAQIKEHLAIGGATKQKNVLAPIHFYQEKINQFKQIDQRFTSLINELKMKIAELVQRDQELAQWLGKREAFYG
ncbi:hypothetical protein [Enterococcus ratti]|nr:hypothetical protein [Enterococcus ratti]